MLTRRPSLVVRTAAVAAFAGLMLAAPALPSAFAHGAVDLEPLIERVHDKLDDPGTTPALRKAYKSLDRALDRPNPKESLVVTLRKLAAVAKAVDGRLSSDRTLGSLLEGALDGVSHEIGDLPDEVSIALGKVKKLALRNKFENQSVTAFGRWLSGKEARGDALDAIRMFTKSAAGFEGVLAQAAKEVKRHGAAPSMQTPTANTVYTYVGSGAPGFNGDGHEARRSSLYFVDECAFGPDGNLYILDWNNHMVRRMLPDGTLERICGSGVPGDSEGDPMETALNHPSSMAFAPDGRIFLAAWHNHKVKVYDPTGGDGSGVPRVYTVAGTTQGSSGADGSLATDAKYNLLPGILRLPNGDLITVDAANQVLRQVELSSPQSATNVAGVTVQTGAIRRFAGITGQTAGPADLASGDRLAVKFAFSKAQNADPDGRMARAADGTIYVVNGVLNVVRRIAPDGTVTTLAGTGTAGYSGDGGAATAAQLNFPSDVAIGPDGSIFISDSNNHVIRRVDMSGNISTYAGTGAAGPADEGVGPSQCTFHRPGGIEVDAAGNLYVCDRENSVIRVITAANPGPLQVPVTPYVLPTPERGTPPTKGATGTIDTYAGSGTLGFNGDQKALDTDLYWPQDCAVDESAGPGAGELYLLDWNNHRVRKVGNDGEIETVVGSGQLGDTDGDALTARLNHPTDLAFHPVDGALWVAGWHTDKIIRLESSNHTLSYTAGGGRSFGGDGGPATAALLNIPSSVKFDSQGRWYIGDEGNRRVRMVTPAGAVTTDVATQGGTIQTIVGTGLSDPLGDNGPAANANLNLPVGQSAQPGGRVAISPDDRYLYIADTNHHRVRRVDLQDPDRTITTIAGNGTAGFSGDGMAGTAAQLSSPVDVDCDAAGNVYISDRDNNAIRKVDVMTGVITTIAGDGDEGYTGDKGPANAARLRTPGGIYVVRTGAQAGRIYVADTYNGVIRVIWE